MEAIQCQLYKGGSDEDIISLFEKTFSDSEGPDEGAVIGELVKRFLQETSDMEKRVFLTKKDDQLVGGVIFSKLDFQESEVNTWILSPAAVATTMQGAGVGQTLIKFAHGHLKGEGVQQVVTYGDIKFYSKVGYQHISDKVIPAPFRLTYPEGWIAQRLDGKPIIPISGKVECVAALRDPDLW
jgi:putative acetyltransferase